MFFSLDNIHSMLVHFPIALFAAGLCFDILANLLENKEFEYAGFWTMCMGLISVPFTLLSGIYIFGSHYEDISTLTSYIGFGILIFTKLHNSYTIANKSHSKKVAISAYMKDAKVFNNIEQTKRQYYLPASFVYGQII